MTPCGSPAFLLSLDCYRVARSQVSLTLAAFGKPGIERKDALGYELSEDALKFLRMVEPLDGDDGGWLL